jgi:hypothetical protein
MMNLKDCGTKMSWPNFEGILEFAWRPENAQSGWPVLGPKFEPRASQSKKREC